MKSENMGGARMEKVICLRLHVARRPHVGDYCGNSAEKSVQENGQPWSFYHWGVAAGGLGRKGRELMHNGPF